MTRSRKSKSLTVIQECAYIKEVLKHCTYNSIVCFDVDNTLLRPTKVEDLGSDQWFRKVLQVAFKKIPNRPHALKSTITLHENIQRHIDVKPVEPDTAHIIKLLQDLNLNTLIITARSYKMGDVTIDQLNQIGIDLPYTCPKNDVIQFSVDGKKILFRNGVLFCDGANKGLCLVGLIKRMMINCGNVVMLDDTRENLEKMSSAVLGAGHDFCGLRYNQLDDRVTRFDLKRANMKLSSYRLFFSASVTNIIDDFGLSEENKKPIRTVS
jgi:hypothetical protein